MSWITIIWPVAAGMSFTFAAVHFLVWLRDREALAYLFFSVSAVAAVVIAMQELSLMRAQTSAEFGVILRWMHVPAAIIVVAMVWFIRGYLEAGRLSAGVRGKRVFFRDSIRASDDNRCKIALHHRSWARDKP